MLLQKVLDGENSLTYAQVSFYYLTQHIMAEATLLSATYKVVASDASSAETAEKSS